MKKGYKQTKEHIDKRMKGASKSWFKKEIYQGFGFKKGNRAWDKEMKGFNKGHSVSKETRDKIKMNHPALKGEVSLNKKC